MSFYLGGGSTKDQAQILKLALVVQGTRNRKQKREREWPGQGKLTQPQAKHEIIIHEFGRYRRNEKQIGWRLTSRGRVQRRGWDATACERKNNTRIIMQTDVKFRYSVSS